MLSTCGYPFSKKNLWLPHALVASWMYARRMEKQAGQVEFRSSQMGWWVKTGHF